MTCDGTAKLPSDYLSDCTRRHGLGGGTALHGRPGEALAFSRPPALQQDVQHVAVLIDRPPQVVEILVDRKKDLIQMPLITWLGPPAPQLIGVSVAKLQAPLADGLIGHDLPTDE
jgi:hypothetical protein